MLNLRSIIRETVERYLDEVKVSDLKKRYPKHGDFIDKASSVIPNKYLEWVVNIVIASNVEPDLDKLSQVLKQFDDNVKRGKIKDEKLRDVSKWIKGGISFSDIDQANKQALEVKTSVEKKKEVKELGVKKWYDDNHYLVVEPKTVEASCYYGSGTKWCISAKESNEFKNYYRKDFDFLFVIDKKLDLNDPHYKLAFVIKGNTIAEVYDASDKRVYAHSIDKDYGVLEKIFGSYFEVILRIVKQLVPEEVASDEHRYGISENTRVIAKYMNRLDNAYYEDGKGWIVDDDVDLANKGIKQLPVFIKVGGNFSCSGNRLTSLAGAPQSVGGDFYCYHNRLTSLEGAPQNVGSNFYCHNNQLTSLEGASQNVGGSFYCYSNKLTSLEGAPKSVGGDFDCSYNELTLKELPSYVKVKGKIIFEFLNSLRLRQIIKEQIGKVLVVRI